VLIISMLFLGERLTLIQSLGGLAILAGLVILAVTETADIDQPNPEESASKKGPG
jgi:drug/metabolite transporter (DMT)-like permease